MRPFHEGLRRSVLIGLAAGLVGGLAALVNCTFLPGSDACAWPGEKPSPAINE